MSPKDHVLKKWLDWYNTPELFRLDPPLKETKQLLGDNVSPAYEMITFEQWYDKYAYKIGKQAALKAWGKLSLTDRMEAYEGIDRYHRHIDATHYAKAQPATWLNGRRWEDEYDLNGKVKQRFPDRPDEDLMKKLSPEELREYNRHLRSIGYVFVNYGNYRKWEKRQEQCQ